jgi:FkbM family methyltransferase
VKDILERLRRAPRKVLEYAGFEIYRNWRSQSLEGFLRRVRRQSIGIEVVYDIGAYKGEWSNSVSKIIQVGKFFLFEPNSIHNKFLEKSQGVFFNVLLSDEPREVKFFSAGATGDSYYREHNEIYDDSKSKLLKSISLDRFVQKMKLPTPDLVKIDTQGSEVDIMLGGQSILSKAKILILECPIVEYNMGAPKIARYLEVAATLGFVPVDVTEVHIMSSRLIQIDIAFVQEKMIQDGTYRK